MKTEAAILVETGRKLDIVELEMPALRPGQVLVELHYSGICHTQLQEIAGQRGPDRFLPHCLGHEGSGVVLEVGADVRKVKAGDRVALSWVATAGATVGGTQYQWEGRAVNAGPVTTFMRHAVVSESRVVPLAEDLDLRRAVLLGCALPTGLGAVLNVAQPRPGQSLVVFGCGGIGTSAIAGAVLAGCDPIIAVDLRPARLEDARRLGATHLIDASSSDALAEIQKICPGGTDFALEATGHAEVIAQALAAVRVLGGLAVVAGNTPAGQSLTIDPWQIIRGKRLSGAWVGNDQPDQDLRRYARLLARGRLAVDVLLSPPYPLSEINQAVEDLATGRVGRPLIALHPAA